MDYAIILAGGKGERFWPISRKNNPKQLLSLFTGKTLLEEAVERSRCLVPSEMIKIVTSSALKRRIQKQISWLKDDYFILEPQGKNTAAAIGLAAKLLVEKDQEALMYVFPSDHIIKDVNKFIPAILTAKEMVRTEPDALVLIGIKPTRPETGYGYIELEPIEVGNFRCSMCYRVVAFKEKPSRPLAQEFLLDKKHYWNSGMFVWRASTILSYIGELMPELYQVLENLHSKDFVRLYKKLKPISIDYGVLEKARKVFVVIGEFFWDDVGSWHAVERIMEKDSNQNVKIGNILSLGTYNSTLINDGDGIVVAYGVSDIIVAKSNDRVLIIHKNRVDDIRNLIEKLKEKKEWERYL